MPDGYRQIQTAEAEAGRVSTDAGMGSTENSSLVSDQPKQAPPQSACNFFCKCFLGTLLAFTLGVGGGVALPYVEAAVGLRGAKKAMDPAELDPFDKHSAVNPFAAKKDPTVKHFYMYRVQNDEDYSPENQNMANAGGALWYLHNEIIWHHWNRGGTYASTPKTRVERFLVATRASDKLLSRGMNFGVVNTYDLGMCTGPFSCENLEEYGPAVGCEKWKKREDGTVGNNFPHAQWVGINLYPDAMWYSLPGKCSSRKFWNQSGNCEKEEPSGSCPPGVIPNGSWNCLYSYRKVGEISIDELEGIDSFAKFIKDGGREYDRVIDKGTSLDFWNKIGDPETCQKRIDKFNLLFVQKYPDQPILEDPDCDFDSNKFYPHFPNGTFDDVKARPKIPTLEAVDYPSKDKEKTN
mmetsp:Transcript_26409/g.47625  ORF Transcript_26409/g.47625 Transcript_26409/m.47625 type:complete len:408 (-) Transcript_26409:61-1284(-)|eukprot:CAMPEP_0197655184 /NCGR_PEP_ID=MMETSP1338-20131121/39301_1 /TAXON_ID=43686 ORGANISM="Pelagodinium beii, Strain RCC1491" /NCGR_SAMPLE_ID=MMETSP1338 /ASSEMBLY_ACC=CAM_ASM_000754 /LENGTH=407 /DNA_ID=CAMNT_0043230783 /DNA_START=45 /DNA_END=1268 /DNA_ORIENTATION=-